MPENLHIVFSEPPEGLSDDEFNRWYDAHLDEILAVRGFESARRFRLEPVVTAAGSPIPHRYLSLYEIEGDPGAAMQALEQAGLGSADLYVESKEAGAGGLELPGWFEDVAFASWNCVTLGDGVEPRADLLNIVFSRPPDGVSDEEFNRWYDAHLAEALQVAGFESARRFRLDSVVEADPPVPFRYLAVYELDGDPDEIMVELGKQADAGWMDFPDWFERAKREGCFVSWNCIAIGDRSEAAV